MASIQKKNSESSLAIQKGLREYPYLQRLSSFSPLVAAVTSYMVVNADHASVIRPYKGWFTELLLSAEQATKEIDKAFGVLLERAASINSDAATALLSAFKKDVELVLAECISMGNSFAMHAQVADCAVYTSMCPVFHKKKSADNSERRDVAAVMDSAFFKQYGLKQSPKYTDEYSPLYIPMLVSVADAIRFTGT